MSTSKHFNKICFAVVAAVVVITILFINGKWLGISVVGRTLGYEERLFDTSYVHSIDIVMDDWDSFIESCENEEYSECTAVIDGNSFTNIGIRAKGNTSLSNVKSLGSQRYSFKIEFDQYDNTKSYYGLDKLCLNNLIQDNTMMKDYIVYQLMKEFGVEAPLCSFVYITVNGEDWGLYLAVEGVEDSFLERNYGSDSGNLYKPDSTGLGGGRGNGKDFNMKNDNDDNIKNSDSNDSGADENTDQIPQQNDKASALGNSQDNKSTNESDESKENTEASSSENQKEQQNNPPSVPGNPDQTNNNMPMDQQAPGGQGGGMGSDDVKLKYIDDNAESYSNIFDNAKTDITDADKTRLISSLKNLSNYENIESTVNVEEVINYFVVHNFVCNGDSYTGTMVHNYYLHENDGQLSMIPWDYNLAFGTFQGNQASDTINTSIDNPVSGGTVDDRPMLGWIFSDTKYTDLYHSSFKEFINKYFENGELEKKIDETAEMIRSYVDKDPTKFCTTEEFDKGVDTLKTFVSLRAEAVEKQLNGDTTAVDTGELNLSDMGTMNSRMDNMDNKGMGGFQDNNMGGSFSLLSMLTVKDENGDEVDVFDIIGEDKEIKTVTLTDGTTIDVEDISPQSIQEVGLTKIKSVTDTDGKVTDMTSYTISISTPQNNNNNGQAMPTPPNQQSNNQTAASDKNTQASPNGTDGMNNNTQSNNQEPTTDTNNGRKSNDSDNNNNTNDNKQNGNPPNQQGEVPNDNNREMMNQNDRRDIKEPSSTKDKAESPATIWIAVGISALVLVAGIVVAFIIKH